MKRKIDASAAIVLIVAAAFLTFAATWLYMRGENDKYARLDEVMYIIEEYYVGDYDREELEEKAAAAMVDALDDPWSYYLDKEVLEEYFMDVNNEYHGIGITIQRDDEGGNVIVEVSAGSPAEQAGIKPGSFLQTVNGTDVTGEFPFDNIRPTIQESIVEGTVTVGIVENGELKEYELGGEYIRVNSVSWEMTDSIACITIADFDARSGEEFIAACDEAIEQGAEGIVIDLRFNPGGMLDELIDVMDYLLPEGDIFMSRTRGGEMVVRRSDAKCVGLPMAVLVNADSYSAAEFLAAALQEYEWAVVVGEQTTGKGYAQQTMLLSDGSAVHISVEEYFTPKGVSLANTGVTPDIELRLEDELWVKLYYGLLEPENDVQLQAALDAVRTAAAE